MPLMIPLSQEARIAWVLRIVLSALLAGIIISFPLWVLDRLFPVLPLLPVGFPSVAFSHYYVCFLLLLCLPPMFGYRRLLVTVMLVLLLVLLLQDQNRWQPWVYIYVLFLLPFCFAAAPAFYLSWFRILLIGIYCWSGIHKLNEGFTDGVFKPILTDFLQLSPEQATAMLPLGYGVGILEIGIGILLFVVRTRTAGILLAMGCHLFLLLYLGPLGVNQNVVVWPWNIAMLLLVPLVFYRPATPIFTRSARPDLRLLALVLLVWVLPVLRFAGCWDHYLSFALYSGKEVQYYVAVADSASGRIDPAYRQFFAPMPGMEGGQVISISDWSYRELKVPFPPEPRLFRRVAASFCNYNIPDSLLYFVELKRENGQDVYTSYTCRQLPQ